MSSLNGNRCGGKVLDEVLSCVLAEAEEHFGMNRELIFGKCRRADIIKARHYAIAAIPHLAECGNTELSRITGINRSTIISARKKMAAYFSIYRKELQEFELFLAEARARLCGQEGGQYAQEDKR